MNQLLNKMLILINRIIVTIGFRIKNQLLPTDYHVDSGDPLTYICGLQPRILDSFMER